MLNYSPNMLKTFQNCKKKYWFQYIEQISVPQKTSFFEKGKKIHALANYYLRGDNIEKLEKALTPDEKNIWQALKNNEYFQKTYVASEYNLSCKVKNYWIGGRIDAVVKDENAYYILDYKTGSIPKNPKYDFQTIIYLLCLSKKLNLINNINFIYIDLKNNKNHIIKLTENKKLEYENKIIEICSEIKNFQLKEDYTYCEKCEFCEYNKICI